MGYGLDDLALVLGKLVDHGVDYVVIGDTVVQLALKTKTFAGDVDIYALQPSPLIEQEFYGEIAEKEGWGYSTTDIGTPRFIASAGDKEIIVEIYENFMDFNIPLEILESAGSIKLKGYKIKLIKPEEYLVLKARQGVDLQKLSNYLKKLKKIDVKLVEKTIKLFPKDEQTLIKNRLASIGLRIK
ncbi:MAG: nucleotidyltransferase [Crenarchaeota archaeon]|nr:nucleotidyltransferase [Thermoproteota archaeon]